MNKHPLFRITTVPLSLDKLLEGQLRFMDSYYSITAISADKEKLKQVGEKEGVKTHRVKMTREITPFQDAQALWKLYCLLKKEKPLIVHSHTPKAGIVGMLAAKLARVPIRLHTVAGLPLLESTGKKRELLNFVEKTTYSCATKIYPNSFGLKEIILREGFCRPEKLKVIASGSSNGIDTAHFSVTQIPTTQQEVLREKLNVKENDFVFIFIGRLVGDKGINELISAFKKICPLEPLEASDSKSFDPHSRNEGRPNPESPLRPLTNSSCHKTKLLLVGLFETNLDPLTPETLQEIETNPNIISVGFQQDVRPYFVISDALVFPSYREGFPNVVMQAGAMGLPSIVTDINGCNEIIMEGKNGTIVPPKNVQALSKAMQRILKDDGWRKQLQQNAREMIVSRYEQIMVWKAILEEYRSLEKEISKNNV